MKTPLFFILFTLSGSMIAQVPFAFNYQGIARNSQGAAFGNQEISLLISIVRGFENGIVEFSEQHHVTTAQNGLFNIRIGQGDFITGNLRNIDWGNDDYFIRTEMDPQGGENYIELGTTQLYAVPYALFALKSAEGGQGGSADDNQSLSLSGTFLSIENGNAVDLSSLQDGVNDADSDPANELQNLSISGSQLSISNGNSVTLPTGGGSGNSPWQVVNNNIISYTGSAEINNVMGSPSIVLGSGSGGSGVSQFINRNSAIFSGNSYADGEFGFFHYDKNERLSHWLGINEENGSGFLQLRNNNQISIWLRSLEDAGLLSTRGPNGNNNIALTYLLGNTNLGFLSVNDEQGETRSAVYVSDDQAGRMYTRGPNGNTNISLNNLAANVNHGYLTVNDAQGVDQAGAYVNASGQGVLFADIKNFRTEHPSLKDHEIVYASLEGPEAAAYLRGTGSLKDGSAEIDFPEHFQFIISSHSMTIMLTPLSSASKGLSVTRKSISGFTVRELWDGEGNYNFDWEVKAVRRGYENYQVVQKKEQHDTLEKNYTGENAAPENARNPTAKMPAKNF